VVAVPQFLAAIGASLLGSVGIGLTAAGVSTALAITVGALAVGFVTYSALRGAKLRSPGDVGTAASQQILVRSTTEPRKIVYGEALCSGPLVFMNTNGDAPMPNGALYAIVALTGHEIDSFQGFYLDDKFIAIADVDTGSDGEVTGGNYGPVGGQPVLYLRGHLGAAAQTVDTMVDSGFALWTSNHRGRGVAYLVARMDQMEGAEEVWQSGAPANISALIRGKKVYDPRLDDTFTGTWGTGSGAHRLATPSTWAYSSNPALCLADYLIDADLGAEFDSARIDYNSVALAADDCDELVDIPTASTEKRFTCNGVLSCLDDHRENIEKILSSMAGTLRYYNGLWRISAGMWPSSSSFALTASDLVGPITYRPQPERTERYNAVRGLYFDPTRAYKETAYLPVQDSSLQTDRDDDLVIWKELDLPMTNSETMCQRLAFRMLAQASLTGVSVFPMGYRGMDIAPGDRGTSTVSELGWSAKNFRDIGVRHVDFVGAELVLKEDEEAAYADPAEGDYGTRTAAGEITFPSSRPDGTPAASYIQDPNFSRTTAMWVWDTVAVQSDGEHLPYNWRNTSPGGAEGTAQVLRAGGVVGGALELFSPEEPPAAGPAEVLAIPRESAVFVAGEYIRGTLRIRKRNNPTLTGAQFEVDVGAASWKGDLAAIHGGAFALDETDINAWTVDEWQSYQWLQEMNPVGDDYDELFPYVGMRITLADCSHDLTLEIDMCNAVPVAAP
jgi:hypothetical protein